jgi:hypothetical protein
LEQLQTSPEGEQETAAADPIGNWSRQLNSNPRNTHVGPRERRSNILLFFKKHYYALGIYPIDCSNFPPLEPGANGFVIENYHYWSDLVLADLVRIWQLPVMHVFFHYIPIITSIIFMTLIVKIINVLRGSHVAAAIALFLFTLGSDASYIFTLLLHGNWTNQVASIDNGLAHYFNMPQVFARLIFVSAIFLLIEWWKKRTLSSGIISVILIGTLFGFKVYYGIYAVIGFCLVALFEVIKNLFFNKTIQFRGLLPVIKVTLQKSKLIFLLAIMSLAIYLPPNKAAEDYSSLHSNGQSCSWVPSR